MTDKSVEILAAMAAKLGVHASDLFATIQAEVVTRHTVAAYVLASAGVIFTVAAATCAVTARDYVKEDCYDEGNQGWIAGAIVAAVLAIIVFGCAAGQVVAAMSPATEALKIILGG